MKMHWKAAVWMAALSCALLLSGVGVSNAADKELRFGYLVADQLHSPAVMVMKERKMLEAKGFKVHWGEFLAGSYLMQEMTSGALDFGSCGAVPAMITRGQGVDVVILASANAEGSSLVVKDSIKTIKDLDGKSIGTPGIGSIQDALVETVGRDNKLKVIRKSMKVSDMPIFLHKGEIDGFIAWEPHAARAVDMKYGHILLTSHDVFPGHQCCVVVTRGDMLKNDPKTTRTVLETYLEAYQWFRNHTDEAVAMVMKNTGMSEQVVRNAMKVVQYPDPPYVDIPSMKQMANGLIESGKLQAKKITDMDKFMNELYRPQLLQEILGKK